MNYATENISALFEGIPFCDPAELLIPAGYAQTRRYFPDLPNLRNVRIIGAEVILGTGATNVSPQGGVLASQAQLSNTWLTLAQGESREVISLLQASRLIRSGTDGRIFPFDLCNVNWQKSYITYTGQSADWTATQTSLCFLFYHKDEVVVPGVAGGRR